MEIQYYGANCIKLTTKQASIIIDDNLEDLGLKKQTKQGDIAVFTAAHGAPQTETAVIVDRPGEFEVAGVSIFGIPARAHMDEAEAKTATMYKFIVDDIRVLVTGHIYPELSDEQLEGIGLVDVVIIPVGGMGYTLDSLGALKIIKEVEPKLVIPTHYSDNKISYAVPQQDLKVAIQELGIEVKETTSKLKLRDSDIPESTQLIVIDRQ